MNYRQIIRESGYRANWIAEKIGVPPSTLGMFLSGKRNLRPEKLNALNKILNIKKEN